MLIGKLEILIGLPAVAYALHLESSVFFRLHSFALSFLVQWCSTVVRASSPGWACKRKAVHEFEPAWEFMYPWGTVFRFEGIRFHFGLSLFVAERFGIAPFQEIGPFRQFGR